MKNWHDAMSVVSYIPLQATNITLADGWAFFDMPETWKPRQSWCKQVGCLTPGCNRWQFHVRELQKEGRTVL